MLIPLVARAGVLAEVDSALTAARAGRGTLLTHADMTAHNTLDKPNEVQLATLPVTVRGNRVEISIPQRAVVLLELKIT